MKGKKITAAAILVLAALAEVPAQHNQVMYYMNIPQAHILNPAFRPSNSAYIGLPVISGVKANVGNNFVNFSDVFMKDEATDSIYTILDPDYDIDDFLAKTKKQNVFDVNAMVQTLGVGFNVGKEGYVSLDVNERVEGSLVIPGDLFTLVFKGNEGFAGSTVNLSSLSASAVYFREAGLGYSTPVSNNIRIGVRGKVLFGIGAAVIDNKELSIDIADDYSHTFNADVALNVSAPLVIAKDEDGNIESIDIDDSELQDLNQQFRYLSGTGNPGFGIDIGASFTLSEKFSLSASVIDLGFIRWKQDVTNFSTENQFVFDGIDMLSVIDGSESFEDLADEMLDSLQNAFKVTDTYEPFTTYLPTGIIAGGSYRLNKTFSLGLLSYSRIVNSRISETLTFTGNVNVGTFLSASAGYTFSTMGYDNLGAGLALRAGIFQVYAVADRIPLKWNNIESGGAGIPLPSGWNFVNLRVGFNLLFGNKIKKREDKPMVEII
ncbi:MAG: DUF5723 family protein [Bacteroidales bacterium]|jgi:hypothetical protein|nr:DUF5723 family protein [Bacteroidales bacterium]